MDCDVVATPPKEGGGGIESEPRIASVKSESPNSPIFVVLLVCTGAGRENSGVPASNVEVCDDANSGAVVNVFALPPRGEFPDEVAENGSAENSGLDAEGNPAFALEGRVNGFPKELVGIAAPALPADEV